MIICNFFKKLLIHPPDFSFTQNRPLQRGTNSFFYENFSSNLFQNVDFQIFEYGFKTELRLTGKMDGFSAKKSCLLKLENLFVIFIYLDFDD